MSDGKLAGISDTTYNELDNQTFRLWGSVVIEILDQSLIQTLGKLFLSSRKFGLWKGHAALTVIMIKIGSKIIQYQNTVDIKLWTFYPIVAFQNKLWFYVVLTNIWYFGSQVNITQDMFMCVRQNISRLTIYSWIINNRPASNYCSWEY